MARLMGSRSADFEAKRMLLLARARDRLAQADAAHPSFRELADSAGVSQATLRHYFGTLDELIAAVFEAHAIAGAAYLAHMRRPSGPFDVSVVDAVSFMARGQRFAPTRAIHAIARNEGVRRRAVAEAYRTHLLAPSLAAIAARWQAHVDAGEMRPCDTADAAVLFAAPIYFAFEHQADLRHPRMTAAALETLLREHADNFVKSYAASTPRNG